MFAFYSAYVLRNNFADENLIIFLLIIITCISTDVGGYVFGKTFKGPKLIKISPNKTFSGMIGGYILSVIFIYVFFYYSYLFYDGITIFTLETLIIILLISTVSQIGDITISYFKRLANLKDTGTCKVINQSIQTHFVFKVITREDDTTQFIKPANV